MALNFTVPGANVRVYVSYRTAGAPWVAHDPAINRIDPIMEAGVAPLELSYLDNITSEDRVTQDPYPWMEARLKPRNSVATSSGITTENEQAILNTFKKYIGSPVVIRGRDYIFEFFAFAPENRPPTPNYL